ncbi:hypothetical protein ABFX02_13G050700 [Erythranthe guttata]
MSHRGRGNSSYRGRGGRTIAQHGNQRLIAENIASITSSSSSNTLKGGDELLFKEFMEFKAKHGNTSQNNPSYANVVLEDEVESDDLPYERNTCKEVILLLEDKDLRWKGEIWHLMNRYLNTASFTAGSYKQRNHYENILKATSLCEFSHFYPGKNTQAYSFSKVIIKQIISAEEWGLSTLGEKEYFRPDQKIQVKYNYWDYVEAFNKAFLYENPVRKHIWFFKICPNVYKKDIPNWLSQWWLSFGPTVKILPEPYRGLYAEWVKISPTLIEAEHTSKWIERMPFFHFFIEFGIPWIWKWEPELGHTPQNIPCIKRATYTKFWKRMLRKNEHGVIEGQETIDKIQGHIQEYKKQIQLKQQREAPNSFQHLSRKLNFHRGQMTEKELIASYMEEVKKDLVRNFGIEYHSDISMATSSHDDEEYCNPDESQDSYGNEADISIDDIINNVKQSITEQIQSFTTTKGKEIMEK